MTFLIVAIVLRWDKKLPRVIEEKRSWVAIEVVWNAEETMLLQLSGIVVVEGNEVDDCKLYVPVCRFGKCAEPVPTCTLLACEVVTSTIRSEHQRLCRPTKSPIEG